MTIDEFRKLSDQEFKMIATDLSGSGEILFAIPIPGATHLNYVEDETSAYILDPIEDWMDAWDKYIETLQAGTNGRRNRTRKNAAEKGAKTCLPAQLSVPTLKNYQNCITLIVDPVAYLQPIEKALADKLQFQDNVLRIESGDASLNDLVKLYDRTPEALERIDVPLLLALYTLIRDNFLNTYKTVRNSQAAIKDPQYLDSSIKIYIPDFMRMLGNAGNISKLGQKNLVDDIAAMDSVVGIIVEEKNGRAYQSIYPVMRFMGYNEKDNILHFASPYCNAVMAILLEKSIQKDKQGRPRLKSSGDPFTLPSHSNLIKSSIVTERNKRAIEIVCAVVTLIEQCGNHTPHIRVQTLIDRCPLLQASLEGATGGNKSNVLRCAFSKAWELLERQTLLKKVYRDLEFPTVIPGVGDIDSMILEFPHNGKGKRNGG